MEEIFPPFFLEEFSKHHKLLGLHIFRISGDIVSNEDENQQKSKAMINATGTTSQFIDKKLD